MKSFRLLLTFTLIILGISVFAQNVTLQVSGHVTDQQTGLPIPNHQVAVTVPPDSINTFVPFSDSVLSDPSGGYSLTFTLVFNPGTASFFSVGTYDCMMNWMQQGMVYTGTPTPFTADFSICNDTIFPPSPCENVIMPGGIQGLTVTLQGILMNAQQASYSWELGDGSTSAGQMVTHTYAQQGIYNITLQTITADGCVDVSNYTVILMDSINPPSGCENYISIIGIQGLTASMQGNLYNVQTASYFWDLGDGNTSAGQSVSHTYAQPGVYTVTLQTITADSCTSISVFPLVLMDSIPNGCASYFTATPTANMMVMAFDGFTQSPYPTEFTWDFGDGTSGSGQSLVHTYCCVGTYNVVLITSDSMGCSSVNTGLVVVYPDSTGTLDINGQVFAGNNIVFGGEVTLFLTDASGYFTPVQSTYINSFGFYHFWNIAEGNYLILAAPLQDSLNIGSYLPTYFGDVIFWEQATQIILGVPQNPYNINLVSFDSIGGGDANISGQLIGGGKSMLMAGQEVLLLDAYGTPVRIAYTDAQGNFSFPNLPFGEYSVNPVLTGMTTQPALVTLDATHASATVTMTINGHTITGISKMEQAGLVGSIYPNPAVNEISFNLKSQGSINIQILDASGKTVLIKNETNSTAGQLITIPVTDLKPGLYFIIIQDDKGNTSSRRFVKN